MVSKCIKIFNQSRNILNQKHKLKSRHESSRKRAGLLQDMHFRNLSQKVLLLKRTEEAAKQLETTRTHSSGGYLLASLRLDCLY